VLVTGVDIIEIERIRAAVQQHGKRFAGRIFTARELAACRGEAQELAARFAAKEAISKALGVGIWQKGGVWWDEMEILPDAMGRPEAHLTGRAAQRMRQLGLSEMSVSLSHCDEYAVAFVAAT